MQSRDLSQPSGEPVRHVSLFVVLLSIDVCLLCYTGWMLRSLDYVIFLNLFDCYR